MKVVLEINYRSGNAIVFNVTGVTSLRGAVELFCDKWQKVLKEIKKVTVIAKGENEEDRSNFVIKKGVIIGKKN